MSCTNRKILYHYRKFGGAYPTQIVSKYLVIVIHIVEANHTENGPKRI